MQFDDGTYLSMYKPGRGPKSRHDSGLACVARYTFISKLQCCNFKKREDGDYCTYVFLRLSYSIGCSGQLTQANMAFSCGFNTLYFRSPQVSIAEHLSDPVRSLRAETAGWCSSLSDDELEAVG